MFLVAGETHVLMAYGASPLAAVAAAREDVKKAPLLRPEDKLTDAELRERSKRLVEALREMHRRWHDAVHDAFYDLKGQELQTKLSQINRLYETIFGKQFKDEALMLERELIKRLDPKENHSDPVTAYSAARIIHSGILVGAAPLNTVASYIESLAGKLKSKT